MPETKTEAEAPVSLSIDEAAWTVRDIGAVVVDRPQDWASQDYVNAPPEPVLWERPHDSI